MNLRPLALAACLALPLTVPAQADEFVAVKPGPSFAAIQPRFVYGFVEYDVGFTGGSQTSEKSARKFMSALIDSKYGNESGNYIVTMEVKLDGRTLVTEPLIAANWSEERKFIFFKSGSAEKTFVKWSGVVADGLVVDNSTNRLSFTVKMLHSKNLSVDVSLFKQLSDLSQTAALSALAPGISAVTEAVEPLTSLLATLLESYDHKEVVQETEGVFTLLGQTGLSNQLRYSDNLLTVNIFLKTRDSQLEGAFDKVAQKFKPEAILAETVFGAVVSGSGIARGTVLDIIEKDDDAANRSLREFVLAVRSSEPMSDGLTTAVRPRCQALSSRLNRLVTSRDANLVYWAFLQHYGAQIRAYSDGKSCADTALSAGMKKWGLDPGPDWRQ